MSVGIQPGGRFVATNVSVKMLIRMAYQIEDSQLTGGPAWINSDRFDIQAVVSSSPHENPRNMSEAQLEAFQEQQRLRVQSLLEDRFQLKLHPESKIRPIYALVVAKNGPKLQKAANTTPDPQKGPPQGPPRRNRTMRMFRGQLSGRGVPLSLLAEQLSTQVGRPVVDKTGLKGLYDFTLQWTPDQSQGQMFKGPPEDGQQPGGNPAPPPETTGPSIFTAIQEQLGLKLQPEKGPVQVFVIDHVEQPSAN